MHDWTTDNNINRLKQDIDTYCGDIPNKVVAVIIKLESGGDNTLESPDGKIGLMQILPYEKGYQSRPVAKMLWNPSTNILTGCSILNCCLAIDNSLAHAIARYKVGIKGLKATGIDSSESQSYLAQFAKAWHLLFPNSPLPGDMTRYYKDDIIVAEDSTKEIISTQDIARKIKECQSVLSNIEYNISLLTEMLEEVTVSFNELHINQYGENK